MPGWEDRYENQILILSRHSRNQTGLEDYYSWMGLTLLTERHADQITGVLSCYDRILVFGTLPNICFAEGMTSYLYAHKVRIFDYPHFPHPSRQKLRITPNRLSANHQ